MANDRIEELDHHRIRITLKNSDGDAVTPNAVQYKVDCETTQTMVLDWTALAASSTVDVIIPSALNAIINDANPYETKRVTVIANYGTTERLSKRYLYDVWNNSAYT